MSKEEISKQPKAIRNRKGDFIKVKGCLDLQSPSDYGIKLEVAATPKDWEALDDYLQDVFSYKRYLVLYGELPTEIIGKSIKSFQKDEAQLLSEIFAFTKAALMASENKKPRGKHKYTRYLVKEIKEKACWLYPFLKYWCKRPSEGWPEPLKGVIKIAEREGIEESLKMRGRYDPVVLTAYVIDKMYGEKAKEMDLKPLFDREEGERKGDCIENFYFTYIESDNTSQKIYKSFIKGKAPEEIEILFNSLLKGKTPIEKVIYLSFPLKDIFKSLKLI